MSRIAHLRSLRVYQLQRELIAGKDAIARFLSGADPLSLTVLGQEELVDETEESVVVPQVIFLRHSARTLAYPISHARRWRLKKQCKNSKWRKRRQAKLENFQEDLNSGDRVAMGCCEAEEKPLIEETEDEQIQLALEMILAHLSD